MKRILIAMGLAVGLSLAATPASARNYDCSKPGNANKAACKTAAKTGEKTAAKTTATKATPAATRTTTSETKTTTTSRHYDCTKPGNANKAACKTAAAQTSTGKTSGAVKTTTKTTATTIDCTKFYNRLRAECRKTQSSTPAKTTVAPAPKPAASGGSATKPAGPSVNASPAGATGQCKDGTYTHSKTHQGACSHHGGVAKWF